ncbi:LacI family DNA-binding transcriptional regulator [Priestia filamentosa]|uniref:LacI family DNA-binding transcriptional regulator n=1 Tax=Priestia filamentosa TaxID=1402861 RepID=UPI0002EF5856|nr:substrate-binding domain-containing protein [Priestia filamentosa]
MKVTIKDVAEKAGVSKTTVSRYLNGMYDMMGEDIRKKIEITIKELKYEPNHLAQGLKSKKTKTIGLIIFNVLNPFSTKLIRGVEDVCRKRGYSLFLCNADNDSDLERKYITELYHKQVDGIITATVGMNEDLYKKLAEEGFPMVFVDRKMNEQFGDQVLTNNFEGAYNAVSYLCKLGHKRIAYLTASVQGVSNRQERLEGYKKALQDFDIDYNPLLVREVSLREGDGYKATIDLLQSLKPTAIFSMNDTLNLEAFKAIQGSGYKMPQDISFLGFDDTDWASITNPSMSVVAQPTYEIGVKVAETILKRIHAKRKTKFSTTIFDTKLIVRNSSGVPNDINNSTFMG